MQAYAPDEFEKEFQDSADDTAETVGVSVSLGEVYESLKNDFEFYIDFFLHEQLDLPVPTVHKDIWSRLTDLDKERILLAIPRDHAKTTIAKLAVIWYWLFTSHRFTVYLSNTNTIAKGACKDIIGFLRSPNFESVFGRIKMEKESETESLWIFTLTMPNGKRKRCILRAIGQGQQMRGINIDNQRPDMAVVDDVEDNENTDSELLQKKLDKWIFGPFLKALARKKKILWLGNILQKTSLLARLSKNPRWNPVVYGCLVKNVKTGELEPLWPGKWSVEALREDFKEYRDLGLLESWMCEMMNMPGHGENGFTLEHINYAPMPTPDTIDAAWITIDPAFGQNAWNDETAICVHVIPKNSCPMTVACVHSKGMTERQMFDEALALSHYWNAWTWGIEAVAAQKVLITLFSVFQTSLMLQGQIEFVPLMAGRGDPKKGRIQAFANLMSSGEWALPEGELDIVTQLMNIDLAKKEQADDLVDSAAYGPAMMDQYLPVILEQFQQGELDDSPLRYGMEVEGA